MLNFLQLIEIVRSKHSMQSVAQSSVAGIDLTRSKLNQGVSVIEHDRVKLRGERLHFCVYPPVFRVSDVDQNQTIQSVVE